MHSPVIFAMLCLSVPRVSGGNGGKEPDRSLFPPPVDLLNSVPSDFPRFFFEGHDEDAQWLSRYCWYHFSNRPGIGKTLFNKEYLSLSDMWLTGDVPRRGKSVQAVYRDSLLAMRIDPEGYVHTHQHFSHAHDYGWPFPLWPQVPGGSEGVTMGWHFQEDGPNWMWLWPMLKKGGRTRSYGPGAIEGWKLENVRSKGIVDAKWRLEATGPSPAIVTPATTEIDALNAPFLQLRWTRSGRPNGHALPYIEWMSDQDKDFGPDRRVHFKPEQSEFENITSASHSIIPMYRHPKWRGKIKRIRISLAPEEEDVKLGVDSFFTVYDTRHSINNPIFILASWNYYRWTGDLAFLRENIDRMRIALRYQQTEMGGLEHNLIRNPWWGHDGLPSFTLGDDGGKTFNPGHGIGNNYWDILPFGGDDMYATGQYYAATLVMAEIEKAIRENPGWDIPTGALALDPVELRDHAEAVKREANRVFWDRKKGRFVACVDIAGVPHDYGFTFLNLDAIWYDIASERHGKEIMEWITGERIVEGDTSTGEDIYRWRFGPRATTLRNLEWYGQGWTVPENIPWGGQVQDGGAVLGFTFYDLWGRLRVIGPDDAWQRLQDILEWEREVWKEGGYREYYKDGKRGTTLQGCGTAGGIGIDCEFFESSLVPSIVIYGFLGLDPTATALGIDPKLPEACPRMGVSNLQYRRARLDVAVAPDEIAVEVKDEPAEPIKIALDGKWKLKEREVEASDFSIEEAGIYRFTRIGR
jgi:hypothetical protein